MDIYQSCCLADLATGEGEDKTKEKTNDENRVETNLKNVDEKSAERDDEATNDSKNRNDDSSRFFFFI